MADDSKKDDPKNAGAGGSGATATTNPPKGSLKSGLTTTAEPPEPDNPYEGTPYTGPSEIVEGGSYIQGGVNRKGKHYGGRVVDANGVVLAEFAKDQENTGRKEDGHKPGTLKEDD